MALPTPAGLLRNRSAVAPQGRTNSLCVCIVGRQDIIRMLTLTINH